MNIALWMTWFMLMVTACFGKGPSISNKPRDVQLSIVSGDEQVKLTCIMTSPIIGSYWERVNDKALPDKNNVTELSSLSNEKKMLQTTISNARPIHTGIYRCVVYNKFGRAQSRNVKVTITIALPVITIQPIDQSIIALQNVTFTCEAKGFAVRYSWKRHRNSDLIKKHSELTVYNATPLDEDRYYCVVRNEEGYAFSYNATLKVDDKLSIKAWHSGVSIVEEGKTIRFVTSASGINLNNYKYEWKKRGSGNLPNKVVGVNTAILIIPDVIESDEGQYYCVVTNEWGRSVRSDVFTLTVKVVTTGSTTIMTTKATTTIIDGLTTSTILPTSTLSNTNILDNKVVTTGSTTIMTTKSTTTIIDGLTTITILPTSILSNTNILDNNDPESSKPLSTIAIVAFVITLLVLIILIILVLIIIKIYLLKKTWKNQQPPVIRLSTVNNIIAADINLKSNPTDIKVKDIPTCAKTGNNPAAVVTGSNSENIKLQKNPAYKRYNVHDYYY